MNMALVHAVREHRIVTFWYDDLPRTEPYIYGVNTAGHEVLSG